MIPRLALTASPEPLYAEFLKLLGTGGFEGDLSDSFADRTVLATDNSIYQLAPQAIAFPRTTDDLIRIAELAARPRFRTLKISPRGGGTGTNGQSLTDGLVVDVSRHMNRILEINPQERWVRVQAGVVKDQLNAALEPHGMFFSPELSTSNRATIGGMISTDACGQGSCLYGKTRDHVLELTSVLLDGQLWSSRPLEAEELLSIQNRPDRIGEIHRLLDRIQQEQAALIDQCFPKLNRSLTGYDLAHLRDARGRLDINSILCGSEGTLCFLAEAKLNILLLPRHSAVIAVRYQSFDAALRDARNLMAFGAASIETIDSKILSLAHQDIIWQDVRAYFPPHEGRPPSGVNLVEFVGATEAELEARLRRMTAALDENVGAIARAGYTIAYDEGAERIWEMRKKAVGLLGNMQGEQRPIPFVEDTAVPPENLADYIAEFRALLDSHGLVYGMFGHVDAGVLHVRPALDMKDPRQQALIRSITEAVFELTRKYGGVLWGEHGKGVRSEYSPRVFGPLYPTLQAIKAAFDPHDQLNPGKVAIAGEARLLTIDGVPTRGEFDRTITPEARHAFGDALHCNGNGACYNYDTDDPMCPSWKGTRERRHSPKGRATLIREWLRQLSHADVSPVAESRLARQRLGWRTLPHRIRNSVARRSEHDFSHAVMEALDGCLACKSCAAQCPIKVDVADFRAKFFELYYGRYLRPVRHYIVGAIEHLVPVLGWTPGLANAVAGGRIARWITTVAGLVEVPTLTNANLTKEFRRRNVRTATPKALRALTEVELAQSVVLVRDAFTTYYDTKVLLDVIDLIAELGFRVWLAPYRPNGKALHVHGFLAAFERVATKNAALLRSLGALGVDLVGIDPSMTLTYRSEYVGALASGRTPQIMLIQEWLAKRCRATGNALGGTYFLLPHCTERTTAAAALRDWQAAFKLVGLELQIVPSGCCGMAGTWGHEAKHRELSEHIYALSWRRPVLSSDSGRLLADGYSCRSQVKLVDKISLPHPASAMLDHLRQRATANSFRSKEPSL